jgi:hypothetical protein
MADRGMLVAARFLDGRVVKGWTLNIRPQYTFTMLEEGSGAPLRMKTSDLKAIFFIKSLPGNPDHEERKDFEEREGSGQKLWVEFTDGEALAGWSSSYGRDKDGFYLYPTDPDSNINMAYIFRSAVKRVRTGPFAQRAASRHRRRPRPAPAITPTPPEHWEDYIETRNL